MKWASEEIWAGKVGHGGLLDGFRMGLVSRKTNHVIVMEGLELWVSPASGERRS